MRNINWPDHAYCNSMLRRSAKTIKFYIEHLCLHVSRRRTRVRGKPVDVSQRPTAPLIKAVDIEITNPANAAGGVCEADGHAAFVVIHALENEGLGKQTIK